MELAELEPLRWRSLLDELCDASGKAGWLHQMEPVTKSGPVFEFRSRVCGPEPLLVARLDRPAVQSEVRHVDHPERILQRAFCGCDPI